MAKKRVLDNLRFSRLGETLAGWLNDPRKAAHPLFRALTLTKELIVFAKKARSTRGGFREEHLEHLDRFKRKINRLTRNFAGFYSLQGLDIIQPESAYFGIQPLRRTVWPSEDWQALRCFVELAEAGALWRMRRCKWKECGLHFYAAPRQEFHDTRCKDKQKRSTEEYKAARAAYMKKRYWKDREPVRT